MDFPEYISLTVTNACNLRCRMCGQWSEEGYVRNSKDSLQQQMRLTEWKRVVDEIAEHDVKFLLIRGGEPFLFPGIIELLEYISGKGLSTSIDTNATMLKQYAADIARIGNIHLTISVDGPEEIHDRVRGVPGCFQRIREGLQKLSQHERDTGHTIGKSINFTISPYSLEGLGVMPDVARSLGIDTMAIVPYYYFSDELGKTYQRELREHLGCSAFSWFGFHHEESGIDFNEFLKQYQRYLDTLDGVQDFPYLPLSKEEFQTWFEDSVTPVGKAGCKSIEKLIDIQPNGDANFCIDFPDYSFGNVKESSIQDAWNSERAERFREYRRNNALAVCHRCGAKYIPEM